MADDEFTEPLRHAFDDSDLNAPPSMETQAVPISGGEEPLLRFGEDTGPLPHWTEPPTGQIASTGGESDLSAWSGFGASGPAWRDESSGYDEADISSLGEGTRLGAMAPVDDEDDPDFIMPIEADRSAAPVATIRTTKKLGSIGTAPSRRGDGIGGAPPQRGETIGSKDRRPPSASGPGVPKSGRNMPVAIAVGVGLAAIFAGLAKFVGAKGLVALVAIVLGFAAAEFFDSSRKAGYQPAQLLGILACAGFPLAAYWRGEAALPHVIAVAMAATLITYMFSGGIESNPLPNTSVTMLGIVYIGLMGSFAGLILQFPNGIGTLWACVLGVVGYDVGGLLFGSSIGRSPLLPWISPNKTWEGLLLGMLSAFLAVMACNVFTLAPWDLKLVQCIQLAIVVAIAAPLGDLAESMLKRSLGTKDFGTVLPGHGGVLDRFDCFLFVLPAAYYVSRILNVY
jgi:phosphatidate cytidylyltransferase